jgi:hypothetical protein
MPSTVPNRVEGTTELLQYAIEAARSLPPETQDEIARAMLALAESADLVADDSLDEDLRESLAEEERGEFASDEEVRAVWAKHGL